MTEIYEFDENISKDLDIIEKDIKQFEKKQNRENHLKLIQRKLRSSKNMIDAYEIEIESADNGSKYKQSLAKLKQRFEELQRETEQKKAQITNTEEAFLERQVELQAKQPLNINNKKELIELGDEYLEKADQALDNAIRDVEDADQIATQIGIELDNQIKRLDALKADNYDIETLLKRSKDKIKYFKKQLQTDKMLRCCLILIFLTLLIIIGLAIFGYSGTKLNLPDQIQKL